MSHRGTLLNKCYVHIRLSSLNATSPGNCCSYSQLTRKWKIQFIHSPTLTQVISIKTCKSWSAKPTHWTLLFWGPWRSQRKCWLPTESQTVPPCGGWPFQQRTVTFTGSIASASRSSGLFLLPGPLNCLPEACSKAGNWAILPNLSPHSQGDSNIVSLPL